MEHLLALQQDVPSRSPVARALGVSPLDEERTAWYRGALGEATVGRLLEKLPEGWTVLHAVPVGKGDSDIDQVVIGPGGVFTINTKNHAGQKVWVAGRTLLVSGHPVRRSQAADRRRRHHPVPHQRSLRVVERHRPARRVLRRPDPPPALAGG
jgi:hypothetical protein